MKILMTGATGFLGRAVFAKCLAEGASVAVLGRSPLPVELHNAGVSSYLYHQRYEDALEALSDFQPDVVLHLATYFVGQHRPEDLSPLLEANIILGLHVLEAMKQTGCRAWVNASSAWQYSGESPFTPNGVYAATKSALDAFVYAYVQEAHLHARHLVIYESYGANDPRKKLIPILWHQFQAGSRRFKLVGTEKKFYFVHVQDIAQAFWQVMRELMSLDTDASPDFLHYALRENAPPVDVQDLLHAMSVAWGEALEGDYGAFPFRDNEVMRPLESIAILPHWQPEITLIEGLKRL